MKKETNKAFRVGVLVFSALMILTLTIYFIGSKNNLFKKKVKVHCVFGDIRGVYEGNLIRFSGINVGSVAGISISSDSTVVLDLNIAKEYAQHIYKNSLVEINQDGLMGGKLLTITNQSYNSERIINGDTLTSKEAIDVKNMLDMSSNILVNVADLVKTLNTLVHKFNSGEGDLSKLLNEDTFSTQLSTTFGELNASLSNIKSISSKVNSGEGDLGTLVNEKKITQETTKLLNSLNETSEKANKILQELEKTTSQLNTENSSVGRFLTEPNLANDIDQTMDNLNETLEQFNQTAKTIEKSWLLNVFTKKEKEKKQTTDSIR